MKYSTCLATPHTAGALTLLAALAASPALAQELRVQCYSDGNECEVTGEIAKRFEAANSGAKIVIDKVPYKAVVEQLPVQLPAKAPTSPASPTWAA